MEPMYRTRNKPTEAGFWWWRNEGVDPDVVWVEMRGKCLMYQSMIGWQHLSGTGGEWSSMPIARPTGGNDAVDR